MNLTITEVTKEAKFDVHGHSIDVYANGILTGKSEDNTPVLLYMTGISFDFDEDKYTALFIPNKNIGGKSLALAEGIPHIAGNNEIYIIYKLNCGNAIPSVYQKGDALGSIVLIEKQPLEVAIVDYTEPVEVIANDEQESTSDMVESGAVPTV